LKQTPTSQNCLSRILPSTAREYSPSPDQIHGHRPANVNGEKDHHCRNGPFRIQSTGHLRSLFPNYASTVLLSFRYVFPISLRLGLWPLGWGTQCVRYHHLFQATPVQPDALWEKCCRIDLGSSWVMSWHWEVTGCACELTVGTATGDLSDLDLPHRPSVRPNPPRRFHRLADLEPWAFARAFRASKQNPLMTRRHPLRCIMPQGRTFHNQLQK
jgi:hypothetical protein